MGRRIHGLLSNIRFNGMFVSISPMLACPSTSVVVNPTQAARVATFQSGTVPNPSNDAYSRTFVIGGFFASVPGRSAHFTTVVRRIAMAISVAHVKHLVLD